MTELDVQIRRSLFAHFRRYNNRSTRIRITSSRRIKLKHNIITRGKLIDSPLLSTFIFYSVLSCRFESWLNIARPSKAICHIVLLSRTVQTSPEAAASTLVSCLSLFQPIFIPHPPHCYILVFAVGGKQTKSQNRQSEVHQDQPMDFLVGEGMNRLDNLRKQQKKTKKRKEEEEENISMNEYTQSRMEREKERERGNMKNSGYRYLKNKETND